jgi:hypothetical protein
VQKFPLWLIVLASIPCMGLSYFAIHRNYRGLVEIGNLSESGFSLMRVDGRSLNAELEKKP